MFTEADVRRVALALPEVTEEPHFEQSSFRVNRKIFCTLGSQPGRIMLKFDPEDQHNLVEDQPDTIAPVPGYWGQKGATLVAFGKLSPTGLEALMRLAWSRVAPRRLLS